MARVILIVGSGYSGSTLLAFLLNSHQSICTVGELSGPIRSIEGDADYRCSCGERVSEDPFWGAIVDRMAERGHDLDLTSWDTRFEIGDTVTRFLATRSLRSNTVDRIRDRVVHALPIAGPHLQERLARNEAMIEAICEEAGASVFVDGSKDPRRWAYLRRSRALEIRVLHLIRDVPGQVASARKNSGAELATACRAWLRTQNQVRRLQRRVPAGSFLRVHYEALCHDPGAELDRIADFAGVEPFPRPVSFRDRPHHIIGNRMRMSSSDEVVLDEKWRTRLSSDEVADLLARTRRTRRWAGYSERPHVLR